MLLDVKVCCQTWTTNLLRVTQKDKYHQIVLNILIVPCPTDYLSLTGKSIATYKLELIKKIITNVDPCFKSACLCGLILALVPWQNLVFSFVSLTLHQNKNHNIYQVTDAHRSLEAWAKRSICFAWCIAERSTVLSPLKLPTTWIHDCISH